MSNFRGALQLGYSRVMARTSLVFSNVSKKFAVIQLNTLRSEQDWDRYRVLISELANEHVCPDILC